MQRDGRCVRSDGAQQGRGIHGLARWATSMQLAAKRTMREGSTAHDVHTAVSKPFLDRGFTLGHVTGHSIGMTMIEFPRIGEGIDIELRAGMVVSMHPHAITPDGSGC